MVIPDRGNFGLSHMEKAILGWELGWAQRLQRPDMD